VAVRVAGGVVGEAKTLDGEVPARERFDVFPLVRLTTTGQRVAGRVLGEGDTEPPYDERPAELRQVRAGEMVGDVGGGEGHDGAASLHLGRYYTSCDVRDEPVCATPGGPPGAPAVRGRASPRNERPVPRNRRQHLPDARRKFAMDPVPAMGVWSRP
jgi:hypothetical protein